MQEVAKLMMKRTTLATVAVCGCILGLAGTVRAQDKTGGIVTERVPDGGIQPQVAVGEDGTLHLLYFRGEAAHGDLWYVRRGKTDKEFSAPIRVNSQPGSAVAVGGMRGGQIALGRGGRVHVVWNGSEMARPEKKSASGSQAAAAHGNDPMLYARLAGDGKAFESQRNLMTQTHFLDGGGTVAADAAGRVIVAWHANRVGEEGELERRVWVARSSDDGATFAAEAAVSPEQGGCCACCGMRAAFDREGREYFLYRAAGERINRDMTLLSLGPKGAAATTVVDRWALQACTVSSACLMQSGRELLLAWETQGQVRFGWFDPTVGKLARVTSAPGEPELRKYPAVAVNVRGEVVLAWIEGAGWGQVGTLRWQVFDSQGRPIAEEAGKIGNVPAWDVPAAHCRPDGRFGVLW